MWTSLLKKIPAVTFEPFLFVAVIACMIWFWKRDKATCPVYMACFLIITVVEMILWRVGIGIGSSRYAAILIYPVLIVTACFALNVQYWHRLFPAVPVVYFKVGGRILIGILVCAGLIKTFHRDRGIIEEVGRKIAQVKVHYREPALFAAYQHLNRFKYYSGIGDCHFLPYCEQYDSDIEPEQLQTLLRHYRYYSDAVFFVIYQRTGAPVLTADLLKVPEECWKSVGVYHPDSKRKSRLTVFCYLPKPANIRSPANPGEIERYRKYYMDNGDFEKVWSEKERKMFLDSVASTPLRYLADKGLQIPAIWKPANLNTILPGVCYSLESNHPIAGKQSLRFHGENGFWLYNLQKFPRGKYELKFLARGKEGSTFAVMAYYYNRNNMKVGNEIVGEFRLPSSKIFEFSLPLAEQSINEGDFFRIALCLRSGDIVFDNFAMVPL